jgi:hypothetical protein
MKLINLKHTLSAASIIILMQLNAWTIPPSSFVVETDNIKMSMLAVKQARFIITYDSADFILPETATQKIVSVSGTERGARLEVLTGERITGNKNNPEKHLANTPLLRTDDEIIKKSGEKFRKSSNPVDEISSFVYRHIHNKTTGLPLITAPLIMKNRTGDCTEHAVLAAALFRSAGIPARGVTGMIFAREFMGRENVFVYHMWIEVFYMGRWQPVDPTRPENRNFSPYIAFAYHDLKSEVPMSYLRAVSNLNNIKVKLKSVK